MLTTLIYRSLVNPELQQASIHQLVQDALCKNNANHVTGILLFDGAEFFQVLEGEEAVINALFSRIRADLRHNSVVLLMQDYSAYRRFHDTGMRLFDAGSRTVESILAEIRNLSHFRGCYLQDERIFRLASTFLAQRGLHAVPPEFNASRWRREGREHFTLSQWPDLIVEKPCQFALQPIVEALTGKVSSWEALIRSPSGESPARMFESVPADRLYHFDLETKAHAFALGNRMLKNNEKLSVNLLPGVLSSIPGAVDTLVKQIGAAGLRPEQIIIEVTETEAITDQDAFYQALKALRIAGTGLAIDDFGSGYSGLALLARFQPDKIKIDMALIEGIHLSGVKQAIVRSIARCCEELGITVVAEGVETMEEWCWLESIGIHLFQGYFFSRPILNDVGNIQWPVRI
ncbi:EAL domain-containing protein (putative c-di-GMP-specific phosphodiesterase class I) [Enterobacter sp. BIGb0383]|uniref:diguanylate phosphodiesterase n=1 Tax=unclassified Enterobacter TaxID=2608935 RepID=UPI000F49F5ED|nr:MULTISPECIES: diguanylate phosphodiesterase [unclassified Enterobacter]ROP49873.1 EAL domain-containing protein (putative c-di-GMP-specific phosphodiesterase class I) [Enterobacter sp. BIGb0383]ROS06385.1 EAL domain-containing protein (putative c-di-GMP-specific phosphodiesterase class I) [Enterobacter sp. BIGb0359]